MSAIDHENGSRISILRDLKERDKGPQGHKEVIALQTLCVFKTICLIREAFGVRKPPFAFPPKNVDQNLCANKSWLEAIAKGQTFAITSIGPCGPFPSFLLNIGFSIRMQKTALARESMDTNQTLINLGKTLTTDQFITYLSEMTENQEKEKGLPYLLAGLEPRVFSDSLRRLSPALLSSLQRESLQEPLHYLLTQIFHEGEALYKHLQQEIQLFEESLAVLNPESLSVEAIQSYLNRIKELSDEVGHFFPTLNSALTLIWQTDRIDLIEKLSNLKEMLLQLVTHAIGSQGNGEFPSTGLYAALETACSTLYDSSLKDSDAAIDGLTRLSIWFYKDYHELGIPLHDEKAAAETAEQMAQADMLTQVQKQLERLNIGTVKELKQAYIFSKEMLKSYIEKNKHLLS